MRGQRTARRSTWRYRPVASGRIQITPLDTKPSLIKLPCSRCGEGQSCAWAFPIDFYERQTWASHRLVCRRCAAELSSGQAWEARRAQRRARSHQEDTAVNRDLELAAINLFVPLYNARTGRSFKLLRMQESPDAVLEAADRSQLGVEIAHLGYAYRPGEHSSGATNELAFLLDRVPAVTSETQVGDRLITELNLTLAKKANKYASTVRDYPIALLVRAASPIWTASNFERARGDIYVPPSAFCEVWLLAKGDDGIAWTHLMRLDQ
jgi:hypothetical protein